MAAVKSTYGAEYVDRLRACFAPAADPERAASMQRYMRDQFPFLGIAAPARERLERDLWPEFSRRGQRVADADLSGMLEACWAEPEREYQYAGMDLLARHAPRAGAGLLPAIERAIVTKSWWDTVDHLCRHGVGALVAAHPELRSEMDRWLESPNLWLNRSAILHQERWAGLGLEPDMDWVFAACARHGGHRDFFVRKAIGWVLRTHAHRGPQQADEVRGFLDAHPELSGLSRREALRRVRW